MGRRMSRYIRIGMASAMASAQYFHEWGFPGSSFSMNPIINIPIMPNSNPNKNQPRADLFLLLAIAAQPKAQASQMIPITIGMVGVYW